jgi:sulfite exporter TauE/SafE
MLLAGLAGSVAHCSFMCGPFVLAQVGARLRNLPVAGLCEQARLRHAVLAPYHLGRITTYAAIGAVAASLGLTARMWLDAQSGWLLLFGAALFTAQAAARLAPAWQPLRLPRIKTGLSAPMRRFVAGLDVTRPIGAWLLGLALGGLPCMFLYSAVVVASSSASPAGGALAMTAFGLGTVPALVVVGFLGHQAGRAWNGTLTRVAPFLLLGNAVMLAVMAARQLAGPA